MNKPQLFKNCIRLLDLFLYPLKCLKCGKYIDPDFVKPDTIEACFCKLCMASGFYKLDNTFFCLECGVKFDNIFTEDHVCEACLKTPLNLNQVRAALEYKGITKDAIVLFKYYSKLSIAKVFEHLLFQAFIRYYSESCIDLIMPVPLHKKRLKQRGFNQAYLMIRNFNKLYQLINKQAPQWNVDVFSFARTKNTKTQTGFDVEQRKNNLKDAFKVINKKAVLNKHILLVDDVFTTGATCNEAAKELLKHNAKKVDALVLART